MAPMVVVHKVRLKRTRRTEDTSEQCPQGAECETMERDAVHDKHASRAIPGTWTIRFRPQRSDVPEIPPEPAPRESKLAAFLRSDRSVGQARVVGELLDDAVATMQGQEQRQAVSFLRLPRCVVEHRREVVGWYAKVVHGLHLDARILYSAQRLLDRYFSASEKDFVSHWEELELAALACLSIALKLDTAEVTPACVAAMVAGLTGGRVAVGAVSAAEAEVVAALDFALAGPTAGAWLEVLSLRLSALLLSSATAWPGINGVELAGVTSRKATTVAGLLGMKERTGRTVPRAALPCPRQPPLPCRARRRGCAMLAAVAVPRAPTPSPQLCLACHLSPIVCLCDRGRLCEGWGRKSRRGQANWSPRCSVLRWGGRAAVRGLG